MVLDRAHHSSPGGHGPLNDPHGFADASFRGTERSAAKKIRPEFLEAFPDRLPADLPIRPVLPQILQSIRDFPFTIVSSGTGSGKTIGIPLHLLRHEIGVIVTQPRIIAARGAATFLAQSIGEELGNRIGYRTANERCDSHRTVCQYVTDGLEVMRMLDNPTRACMGRNRVLMIDEFHERNLNHDALLAYLVDMHHRGRLRMPVIISSATIDSAGLQSWLGDANVITAEGRRFPIERREPGRCPVIDGVQCAAEGLDLGQNWGILHFVAGKREIYERIDHYERQLEAAGIDAVVLALHSEITPEQQIACMRDYGKPKFIVCTNIAEASVTIPGIKVVVDEGLRRLILTKQGVQGLYTVYISNAESQQRAGRCGRLEAGIYIDHHPLPPEERPAFPPPEILRLQLPNLSLRFKALGHRDPRHLPFLDRPPLEAFDDADRILDVLGCVDGSGTVNNLGKRLARIPLSVNLSRMLAEAERLGVLREAIKVAALIETGGITEAGSSAWRDVVSTDSQSDALAQLDLYRWAEHPFRTKEQLIDRGVDLHLFNQAQEALRELEYRFRENLNSQRGAPRDERRALLQCLVTGFKDNIFFRDRSFWRSKFSNKRRELGRDSVVDDRSEFIVGVPWDMNLEPGGRVRHFVRWATAIPRGAVPNDVLATEKRLHHVHDGPQRLGARSRQRGFSRR